MATSGAQGLAAIAAGAAARSARTTGSSGNPFGIGASPAGRPTDAAIFISIFGLLGASATDDPLSSSPFSIHLRIVSRCLSDSLPPPLGIFGSCWCVTDRYSRLPAGSPALRTLPLLEPEMVA